jgi:hypothetical protein
MQLTTKSSECDDPAAGVGCRMLAEEDRDMRAGCKEHGSGVCALFQGYFSPPEMMNTHDMPANQMNYLRMLQEYRVRSWRSKPWSNWSRRKPRCATGCCVI